MSSVIKEDRNPSHVKRVAVVGAGVSGLAAAYKLKSHGLKVTVFEAEERAGGKLRSVNHDGLIWDEGANTMTESEMEVKSLIGNLGIREKQQFPISQNKRYIVRNGKPILIPTNPIALITSNILSAQSKFQIILEPFLWKKRESSETHNAYTEESVGEFFQRHFGKEVVDYLIDPFVAGTSAGDPESLSVCHSFPELWNLEKRFGSIIAGVVQAKLSTKRGKSQETKGSLVKKKQQRGSFSFFGGMQTLTDTLCKALAKDELRLESKVFSLSYNPDSKSAVENWSLSYAFKGAKHLQNSSYDAIVMTAPLCNVKEMKITKNRNIFSLNFLPEVSYMPLSVVITTFKKDNVKSPLEGFGVLVPSKEQQNGLKTLGTLFSSMMFPDRAPNDLYLYTTFVGGSRNKELAKASTDDLKQIVTSDLRQLLGAEGEPTFVNHFYWSKAFPLYGRNYDAVLEAIDTMEKDLPGFFYAGNHKGGLSVGKAIASGCKAADLVISYLESSSDDKMLKEGPSN
ncbi:protoporphyrinogen oxidase 2, chloroplastic/mitochondrial isoform X2 [Ricinus communis]|uniref:protoporphyrinogen oxidase 2, chloroplastic/mitochondrial isoform X2 n=1 Tax=Ricinus communis TaxID=3988 RepID=UPI00201A7A38|nr:protoporphyrinogen oxidase 2, chloroplastic/mitochondrial isoform X2 [Ricinus communis]